MYLARMMPRHVSKLVIDSNTDINSSTASLTYPITSSTTSLTHPVTPLTPVTPDVVNEFRESDAQWRFQLPANLNYNEVYRPDSRESHGYRIYQLPVNYSEVGLHTRVYLFGNSSVCSIIYMALHAVLACFLTPTPLHPPPQPTGHVPSQCRTGDTPCIQVFHSFYTAGFEPPCWLTGAW